MASTNRIEVRAAGPRVSAVLWTIQGVLAALFLFAGGAKLAMPVAALQAATHLPGAFMRFISVAEVVGGLGLILPGLLKIRTGLTPLAAAGLVLVMIGATALTVAAQGVGAAVFPFAVGVLSALVAWGRWQWAPLPAARVLRLRPIA